jgi:hypothetical protein
MASNPTDMPLKPCPIERYRATWSQKTKGHIEKEISSMRKYMQRHSSAYAWHGSDMTPPRAIADGDKLNILRELLEENI